MAHPRTPLAKAALTGVANHNPQRFRPRREPKASGRPLGDPPEYMNAFAKRAWAIFADELPWLTYEDRGSVEIVSMMRARIIEGDTENMSASFFGTYRMALSSLGATPVDKTKVYLPPEKDDDDPFSAFDVPKQ